MRYVPILDAGVARREGVGYDAYDEGIANNSFIKINNETFYGAVWPKDAVFPDFYSDSGVTYWKNQLTKMHNRIAFDGLWEDMNEAANFCNGACYDSQIVEDSEYNKLTYIPGSRFLFEHAISIDAEHGNGYKEADTHSLFGYSEVKTTSEWFTNV